MPKVKKMMHKNDDGSDEQFFPETHIDAVQGIENINFGSGQTGVLSINGKKGIVTITAKDLNILEANSNTTGLLSKELYQQINTFINSNNNQPIDIMIEKLDQDTGQLYYEGQLIYLKTRATAIDGLTELIESLGIKGVEGPKGERGPQGPEGIQGPQGPEGEQGPIGLTGPQGAKGDKGDKGDTGAQGPKGSDGTSVTIKGTKDSSSELPSTGAVGDAWLILGDLFIWTGDNKWENVGTIQGPKGEQGPKGDVGETGLTGPQGPTGPRGNTGIQGLQGPRGPQGEQGEQGPKGTVDDLPLATELSNGLMSSEDKKSINRISKYTFVEVGEV